MNRHTARLMVAIGTAWVIGALAATPLVPYRAYVLVFVAVLAVPCAIIFWDNRIPARAFPPWQVALLTFFLLLLVLGWMLALLGAALMGLLTDLARRPHTGPPPTSVRLRYRIRWLALALTAGTLLGWFNMFGFNSTVLSVDGERVHATVTEVVEYERSDGGYDTECVLTRPNGTRIPGALVAADGCRETEDVLVSRHGLVDPMRAEDAPDGADLAGPIAGQLCVLIFALALCVPAAWPRSAPGRLPPTAT